MRLRLFEMLGGGPARSVRQLAARLGLSPDAAQRLLRAAASLKLLRELPDDRFALGDLGAAMLGNPSVAAMVEHHALLYDDLRDPVALLRGETRTRLSQFWPYAEGREGDDADLRRLQRSHGALANADRRRCARRLSTSGATAACSTSAAARAPSSPRSRRAIRLCELQLFDLPPVAERARARLAARGLTRVDVHGGSFIDTAPPRGADIVTLVRVLHDHDDDTALAALRCAHDALPPGGALLIAEPMAETPGAEAIGDAYFGFYLLAMGSGRARRRAEMTQIAASRWICRDSLPFDASSDVRKRDNRATSVIFS